MQQENTMLLPLKPFGRIDPVDYYSSGIEVYHFGCGNCGILWELRRISSDDPSDKVAEGYYLSFYHEDNMLWLGPIHEDPNSIQYKARNQILGHPCFKTRNKSSSFGCLSIILIVILAMVLISFLARVLIVAVIIAPFAILGLCIYGLIRYFRRKKSRK